MDRPVPFILLGLGPVGRTLVRQILDTHKAVAQRTGFQFVLVGIADSSGLMLEREGIPEEMLLKILQDTDERRKLNGVIDLHPHTKLNEVYRPGMIVIDATHSTDAVPRLKDAVEAGCGIVMANKVPLAGEWAKAKWFYDHPLIRYEATVGAGLPIISTLRYLLDTGDEITSIEASVSGTLGFLCTALELGLPYSVAVANARNLGYTELDPRDDLSGYDIVRKALILARTAGWPLEMNSLSSEPMYPPTWISQTVEDFMKALPSLDEIYAAQVRLAQNEGKSLRYVAHLTSKGGRVGLTPVARDGYIGSKSGPVNSVAIYTHRYRELPLVISGPGAGPEIKAAGVMEDMLQLANVLQNKLQTMNE
ncbi:MAG: homoserine dehydrogenase [Ignavibacteriae bacterium]|nr:MAG: homoserine dehydrogenase [Ignavibacteriota bacterium]